MLKVGTRKQVMNGDAVKTSGGLMPGDLRVNKYGKIVSVKVSDNAINRLNNMKGGETWAYLYKLDMNKNINTTYNCGDTLELDDNNYIVLFKTAKYYIIVKIDDFIKNIYNKSTFKLNVFLDKLWYDQIKKNSRENVKKLKKNLFTKEYLIVYKNNFEYNLGVIKKVKTQLGSTTRVEIKKLTTFSLNKKQVNLTNKLNDIILWKKGSIGFPFFIVRDYSSSYYAVNKYNKYNKILKLLPINNNQLQFNRNILYGLPTNNNTLQLYLNQKINSIANKNKSKKSNIINSILKEIEEGELKNYLISLKNSTENIKTNAISNNNIHITDKLYDVSELKIETINLTRSNNSNITSFTIKDKEHTIHQFKLDNKRTNKKARGIFGSVKIYSTSVEPRKYVAVKKYNNTNNGSEGFDINSKAYELIISKNDNNNDIDLKNVFIPTLVDANNKILIMSYGISLYNAINGNLLYKDKDKKPKDILLLKVNISRILISHIMTLYKINISYTDLKPKNILVSFTSTNMIVKLIDIGSIIKSNSTQDVEVISTYFPDYNKNIFPYITKYISTDDMRQQYFIYLSNNQRQKYLLNIVLCGLVRTIMYIFDIPFIWYNKYTKKDDNPHIVTDDDIRSTIPNKFNELPKHFKDTLLNAYMFTIISNENIEKWSYDTILQQMIDLEKSLYNVLDNIYNEKEYT